MAAPRLAFEVKRFEWTANDRLEVTGRWSGLRGYRFLRPTLDIEFEGQHRRLLALLEHKPWAPDDGREWVAAFAWQGGPVHVAAAELAVGPDLTVELPLPEGDVPPPAAPAGSPERRDAGRPRAAVESDLAEARADGERLNSELERALAGHAARVEELQRRLEAEREEVAELGRELDAARQQLREIKAVSAARVGQLGDERDAALAASAAALAETKRVESGRDAALRARSAVEQERDAAVRARDSARQERNAWMSRARTSVAESGPTSVRRAADPAQEEPAGERPAASAGRPEPPAPRRAKPEAAPAGRGDPRARPGVRTVRIGAAESLRPPPGVGMDAPAGDAGRRRGPLLPMPSGSSALPVWTAPLLAALVLLVAVVILVLLLG